MLALKKKRETEAKAAADEAAAAAAAAATAATAMDVDTSTTSDKTTSNPSSAPEKISLLGSIGGIKKKTAPNNQNGVEGSKKRTPGEIRIQKGERHQRQRYPLTFLVIPCVACYCFITLSCSKLCSSRRTGTL